MNIINNNRPIIIGVDHGFGNIKTAHTCFKTGVTAHDKEPTFKSDLLIYEGRYYTIGEEHKEFIPDKALDQDYYILTLAAIARELRFRGVTMARVYLAAGLPLTWVSEQKDTFKAYLLQKPKGAHVYVHSRKDGNEGTVWLVINNSLTEATTVELPKEAERYTLSGNGKIRSRVMLLNGKPLTLGENDELPPLEPVKQHTGTVELAPGTCTFFVL